MSWQLNSVEALDPILWSCNSTKNSKEKQSNYSIFQRTLKLWTIAIDSWTFINQVVWEHFLKTTWDWKQHVNRKETEINLDGSRDICIIMLKCKKCWMTVNGNWKDRSQREKPHERI